VNDQPQVPINYYYLYRISPVFDVCIVDTIIENSSRNKRRSFEVSLTLWVSGKKVLATALVDSGATTTFINESLVKKQNLLTHPIDPITVINADGTTNQSGSIDKLIRAYTEMGHHTSREELLVANLGSKDVIIGYAYLRKHNPSINWREGTWHFNGCPEVCHPKAVIRTLVSSEEIEDFNLHESQILEPDYGLELEPSRHNPFVSWISTENKSTRDIVQLLSVVVNKDLEELDDDEEIDESVWKKLVPKQYWDYGTVFSKKKSERMPTRKSYDHAIEFIEGAQLPKPAKVYPLSPLEKEALNTWIDEELRKGYIRKSKSPIAAPVFFVKKKDGALRLVQNYKKLNDITVKNRYPLPRINDLINALSKAKVYTKIDLRWGYNNVRIKKGDEWKTAFITHRGLFEATVMYFGFSNAPATFQAMMNEILFDFIAERKVMVYMDDILIFTITIEENRSITAKVLARLRDNDLFAKPEKCFFEKRSIEYLGVIISQGHVEMDPSKLKAVLDWPTPEKVKHVQAFVGFANFYRRFIQDFSKIVQPLTSLTRKDMKWE